MVRHNKYIIFTLIILSTVDPILVFRRPTVLGAYGADGVVCVILPVPIQKIFPCVIELPPDFQTIFR